MISSWLTSSISTGVPGSTCCITDHVMRDGGMITAAVHGEYLSEIRRQAERARRRHGLLLPVEPDADAVVAYLRRRRRP